MLKIEILEINNGFTVYLFDTTGREELDTTQYCKTFKEVLETISNWKTLQDKEKSE